MEKGVPEEILHFTKQLQDGKITVEEWQRLTQVHPFAFDVVQRLDFVSNLGENGRSRTLLMLVRISRSARNSRQSRDVNFFFSSTCFDRFGVPK
jgi:hypothetical protein